MVFTVNFMSFGSNHTTVLLMVASMQEANGKSLVIFQTGMQK